MRKVYKSTNNVSSRLDEEYPVYALIGKYGIRLKPCCARDAAIIVLSQHFKLWALFLRVQRDRRKPRRSLRDKARPAIAGSKPSRTRHGGELLFEVLDY